MTFAEEVVGQPEPFCVKKFKRIAQTNIFGNLIPSGPVMQNCRCDDDIDADDNRVYRAYVVATL